MTRPATLPVRIMLWGLCMVLLLLMATSALVHLSIFVANGMGTMLADRISEAVGHIEHTFGRYGFGGVKR